MIRARPWTDLPAFAQTAFSPIPPGTCLNVRLWTDFYAALWLPPEPGRHLLLEDLLLFPFKNLLFGFLEELFSVQWQGGARSDKHHTSIMLATELMIHSSENKSPQKLLWTVIFFVSSVETRGFLTIPCGCPRSGQRDPLGFDCPSVKNHIFKCVRGTPCLVASYAGLKSPELGSRQLQLSFLSSEWRGKEFQNACSTVCFSAGHLNKPIPKKGDGWWEEQFLWKYAEKKLQALTH